MKKAITLVFIFILLESCSLPKIEKPIISVSILPQKFFVEQIVKDKFSVKVLVGPGQSPASYEPLPSQLVDLKNSKLFFRIGVNFENVFLPKIVNYLPQLPIIDTRKGIKLRELSSISHSGHNHRDHEMLDPHIWLSPELVKIQAKTILESVIDLDSENKDFYTVNYNKFIIELNKLDNELKKYFIHNRLKEIMVFHPSWGYLLDLYGIKQLPIQIEGKSPSPKQLMDLMELAKKKNIKVIFVQKQFSTQSAEAIAQELGAKVIQIDPLSYDYYNNLRKIAKKIEGVLE